MVAAAVIPNQNVVERVSSLPLVSSTYGLVSSAYFNTKSSHPYIRTVCEAAELGLQSISSVVLTTASPIIDKLEPQLTIANALACKGLDRIEKTLPILHQPSEQIVSSAKDVVTTARHAVTGRVSGAKDTVSDTLSTVVDRTRGAVQGGMERTRAVVSGSVNTVLESRVALLVSSSVDSALSTSESLVEQYLPLAEDELGLEERTVQGFDQSAPSYYVRLGSLSSRLRRRAYSRTLAKLQEAKQRSKGFIEELNVTVDLIEYSKRNLDSANQMVGDKLSFLVAWRSSSLSAEAIESRTLSLARSLSQQLQTSCLVVVSGVQGLPNHVQREALSLSRSAAQLYTSFGLPSRLRELPDSVLGGTRVQLGQMKESLDNVMDYLVNNTPLNWLVGPFYPHTKGIRTLGPAPSLQPRPEKPLEMEMEALSHEQQS